jgi:hypothetical protein
MNKIEKKISLMLDILALLLFFAVFILLVFLSIKESETCIYTI